MTLRESVTIWNGPPNFLVLNLVNKLVFYEALLKRYRGHLPKIAVPDHISQGDALRLHLEKYFAEAKEVTRDYETVFGEDHTGIGNRLPVSTPMPPSPIGAR